MPYVDQGLPHAGSAEVLFSGMFDEPAGTLARTVPRVNLSSVTGTFSGGTGVPTVRCIPLPAGLPVSNLAWLSGSTAEVGGAHAWMALMDINSKLAPAFMGVVGAQAAPPAVGANLGAITSGGGNGVNFAAWIS